MEPHCGCLKTKEKTSKSFMSAIKIEKEKSSKTEISDTW